MDDYDDDRYEVEQDIIEEGFEYAANFQRSEDEGWFYPDTMEDAE